MGLVGYTYSGFQFTLGKAWPDRHEETARNSTLVMTAFTLTLAPYFYLHKGKF